MPVNEKLKKCFEEGKRNRERHQVLRKMTPNAEAVQGHLAKAIHNFEAMIERFVLGTSKFGKERL